MENTVSIIEQMQQIQQMQEKPMIQAPVNENIPIETQFNNILQDVSTFKNIFNEFQTKIKALEKSIIKEKKELQIKEKKKTIIFTKNPSGFSNAMKVSDELLNFMKKPIGTTLSRTDITQYITQYIKDNKLQNMEQRKKIIPNEELMLLFKLNPTDELTYFNLQKYINIHINCI